MITMRAIGNFRAQALAHARNGLGAIALFALIGGLLNFVGQALIARLMTPHDVGYFGNVIALATLLAPIGGAGVYGVWLQMFPKQEASSAWIKPGIYLAMISTAILMVGLVSWGYITEGASGTVIFFLIGSQLVSLVALELNSGSFQVQEKYNKFALYQAWPQALRLAILAICGLSWNLYSPNSKILGFAIGHFVFSSTITLICARELRAFFLDTRRVERERGAQVSDQPLGTVMSFGWPFVANTVLLTIYGQATVIIAAHVLSYSDAAIYMAANAVVASGYIVIGLMYRRYFQPRMFKLIEEDLAAYINFARKGLVLSIFLGLALAVGTAAGSRLFLTMIFGPAYAPSVSIVYILSITVFFRCMINHMGSAFVRRPEVVFRSRVQLIGLVITIPVMIFLSGSFGLPGLAWSCVFFDLFLVLSFYPRFSKILRQEAGGV